MEELEIIKKWKKLINHGVSRVILGTAALEDEEFVSRV